MKTEENKQPKFGKDSKKSKVKSTNDIRVNGKKPDKLCTKINLTNGMILVKEHKRKHSLP